MATSIGIVFVCLAAIGWLTREEPDGYRMSARQRRRILKERLDLNPAWRRK